MSALQLAGRAARRFFREVCDSLVAVVFPAPCRVCQAALDTAGRIPICAVCLNSFEPVRAPRCEQCGRPFPSMRVESQHLPRCHLCRRGVYAFELARSYGVYDAPMVRAITLLKYEAVTPLGRWFARRLAELVAREPQAFAVDVVVPVPLHPSRLRERGYNQAELIARPLARRLRVPLRSYLLVRTRPRPDRLKLSRQERWRSVRGAYALREGSWVDNLRVLLVDDVFTTGATLDACSRALRRAGAARVVALTVARAVPGWVSTGRVGE